MLILTYSFICVLLNGHFNLVFGGNPFSKPFQDAFDENIRFTRLFERIFDNDENSELIPPDQLKLLIEEANGIVQRQIAIGLGANEHVDLAWRSNAIGELILYSSIISCSQFLLNDALFMEDRFDRYPNIHQFLHHYNRLHMQLCISKLNGDIERAIERINPVLFIPEIANQMRAALVASMPEREHPHIESLSHFINSRLFARTVMDHLESLGIEVEKPVNRSVDVHLRVIEELISNMYRGVCFAIRLYTNSSRSLYLRIISRGFKPDDFEPIVQSTIDYLDICDGLSYDTKKYLFPLAKYEFHLLNEQIFSIQDDLTISPEQMKELIQISLHAAQAELAILNTFPSQQVRNLIDVLTVSELSDGKCFESYIRSLKYSIDFNERARILWRYLIHYSRLQMRECIPKLSDQLSLAQMDLDPSDLSEIEKLRVSIKTANTEHSHQTHRLYINPISDQLLVEALKLYLELKNDYPQVDNNELVCSTSKNDHDHDDVNHMDKRVMHSICEACKKYTNIFREAWTFFKYLIKLDLDNSSQFVSQETLQLMVNYNICLSLVKS